MRGIPMRQIKLALTFTDEKGETRDETKTISNT